MKTALLVIDVQQGFMDERTKHLPAMIRDHIAASEYDEVVFSVFVNDDATPAYRRLAWSGCMGPPATDIASELHDAAARGTVFEKRTYSLFKAPGFPDFLRDRGITRLSICGVDLDACVAATAFDAFDLGYDFEVRFELCGSTYDQPDVLAAVEKVLRRNFGAASSPAFDEAPLDG